MNTYVYLKNYWSQGCQIVWQLSLVLHANTTCIIIRPRPLKSQEIYNIIIYNFKISSVPSQYLNSICNCAQKFQQMISLHFNCIYPLSNSPVVCHSPLPCSPHPPVAVSAKSNAQKLFSPINFARFSIISSCALAFYSPLFAASASCGCDAPHPHTHGPQWPQWSTVGGYGEKVESGGMRQQFARDALRFLLTCS